MNQSDTSLYQHYKNKNYKFLKIVRHSETGEELALYETRYDNEKPSSWVRPKEMFFENVVIEGESLPRFRKIEFDLRFSETMPDNQINQAEELLNVVFGNFDKGKIKHRLANKDKLLMISAYDKEQLVGFKLGYQQDKQTFYSWLGAVSPPYQGFGIGQLLMNYQLQWCRENGFRTIETKTMNKWQAMLILNIRNGFLIVGTEASSSGELKIVLRKNIKD